MEENQIVISNLLPISFQNMISGRFEEALEYLLNDHEELPRFMKALDDAFKKNKGHALEIKDRNFFKRVFSSNVNDLANIAYEQNVIMSAFYLMLLLQNSKTEACQKLLADLYSCADKDAKTTGKEQSNIQKMIKAVLDKNAEDLHMNEVRDKALMKLLRSAEYQHQFENDIQEKVKIACENYEAAKSASENAIKSLSDQIEKFIKAEQEKHALETLGMNNTIKYYEKKIGRCAYVAIAFSAISLIGIVLSLFL